MPIGDPICHSCGQHHCVCGKVLENLFKKSASYQMPLSGLENLSERRLKLLDEIEQIGCSCDSVGYSCTIHSKVNSLRRLLTASDISMIN
jgi:hypothetical protein